MKVVLCMLVVTVLLSGAAACAAPAAAPTSKSTPSPATAPAVPKPAVSPTPPASTQNSAAALSLRITQPADNSIVSSSRVQVKGLTSPGAVVSVNEGVTSADNQGNFVITINLEEGPNILEIIASDDAGNELKVNMTLTWLQGG